MVRGQRENIQNGLMGDKRFEDESGRECSISRQRARLHSGDIHVGGVQGGSQCYEWGHSRGAAPRVRAVKSSEFGQGKL